MSFLFKMTATAAANKLAEFAGAPFPPIPTPLSWGLFTSSAGADSDRLPPVVTTFNGEYRDLRDPTGIWRTPSGDPVTDQRQRDIDNNWNDARDRFKELIPPPPPPLDFPFASGHAMDPEVSRFFDRAKNPPVPRDPLVLDLDGDGIETTPINPARPTCFDHDGDGIRAATGWIRPDDALLVLDLNGNGRIDNGRELFGDNTRLRDGSIARNGFEALAQHDANGDGRIDRADPIYERLQLWRDANADGMSQSSELVSLAQVGIVQIGTGATPGNIDLGHGNTQVLSGSFVRAGGATGASGTAQLAGSLLLAANDFYREFADAPPLTAAAQRLPQMEGSGWVRDLREAMSLGTPQAQALQTAVAAFAAATDREAQQGTLLRNVIDAWADTSGRMIHNTHTAALIREGSFLTTGSKLPGRFDPAIHLSYENMPTIRASYHANILAPEAVDVFRQMHVLEVFNGSRFIQIPVEEPPRPAALGATLGSGASSTIGVAAGLQQARVELSSWQVAQLSQAWDALTDSVYGALIVQTRLMPYFETVRVVLEEDRIRLDASLISEMLDHRHARDATAAAGDLIDLMLHAREPLIVADHYTPLLGQLRQWASTDGPALQHLMRDAGISLGGSREGSDTRDVLLGLEGDDELLGHLDDDVLDGGAGQDCLLGGGGRDTLIGGSGNDFLSGGVGSDTYLWAPGHGNDTVAEHGAASDVDVLFLQDVRPRDVRTAAAGSDLFLHFASGETLRIEHGLSSDPALRVDAVFFDDGSVWQLGPHGVTASDWMLA